MVSVIRPYDGCRRQVRPADRRGGFFGGRAGWNVVIPARTDIAGARAAGIDGLFITGGLQGAELGVDAQGNAEPARLEALCAATGEAPAAALPALRW